MHPDLLVARRGVEADDVLLEVLLGLVFDELVEAVVGEGGAQAHEPVGHGHLFLGGFHVGEGEVEGVRVLAVLEEEHLHEEPLPPLQGVPFQTPHVHGGLLRFSANFALLLVRHGGGRNYKIILLMQRDSDVVLKSTDGEGHIEGDIGGGGDLGELDVDVGVGGEEEGEDDSEGVLELLVVHL